jgi:hypothetical protein
MRASLRGCFPSHSEVDRGAGLLGDGLDEDDDVVRGEDVAGAWNSPAG